jgi:hypothetical protein
MTLFAHKSTQWRLARLSLAAAAVATVAAGASATGRHGLSFAVVAGIAISNAGFQLRFALQEDPVVLRAAVRTRWFAASLLLLGATIVGGGLGLFELR